MLKINVKKDASMVTCNIQHTFYVLCVSLIMFQTDLLPMHLNKKGVIAEYFLEPNKVHGFFSASLLEVNSKSDDICQVPLPNNICFDKKTENKANVYRELFGFCGECIYAVECGDGEILAGFAHGALMKARNVGQHDFPYTMLVPKIESSLYGSPIRICQYLESAVNNSQVIVGQQNNTISVWNFLTGEILTIGSTKKMPIAIVNGPITNTIIAQYSGGFSLFLIDKDGVESKIKDFLIGTQDTPINVLSVAPYKCGIAVKTDTSVYALMPYSKEVYAKIVNNNFNILQIKRLQFLIDAVQKRKAVVDMDHFEKKVFDTLPFSIKALFTIFGPEIHVHKRVSRSVRAPSFIAENDDEDTSTISSDE